MKPFYLVDATAEIVMTPTKAETLAKTHCCIFETPEQVMKFIKPAKDAIIASLKEEDPDLEIIEYEFEKKYSLQTLKQSLEQSLEKINLDFFPAAIMKTKYIDENIIIGIHVKKCFAQNATAIDFDTEAVPMEFSIYDFIMGAVYNLKEKS